MFILIIANHANNNELNLVYISWSEYIINTNYINDTIPEAIIAIILAVLFAAPTEVTGAICAIPCCPYTWYGYNILDIPVPCLYNVFGYIYPLVVVVFAKVIAVLDTPFAIVTGINEIKLVPNILALIIK